MHMFMQCALIVLIHMQLPTAVVCLMQWSCVCTCDKCFYCAKCSVEDSAKCDEC